MQYASHFNGRTFSNPVPTEVMKKGSGWKMIREFLKDHPGRVPEKELGPFTMRHEELHHLPAEGLRLTWLGHSTLLLEMEGKRFLTDPVWYQRASPFTHLGPKRFFEVPVSLQDLPPVDYVLLSHDHYDHLDKNAILWLTGQGIPVITFLGVGKRLRKWGIAENLISEMDWWQQLPLDHFTLTACPARHFSGRGLQDRFTTLWGSFALRGRRHNVYYGADSGMYPGFRTIGEKLGPFDLTLLEIGAYHPLWEPIHMGPENAVQAHLDLKGGLLMPIHWGTFALAFHPWKEPVERLMASAARRKVPLLLPAPGQTVNADNGPFNSQWWTRW